MTFMQNNNKKRFFYMEKNQIMILPVQEKTEDSFHFPSAKTSFSAKKSI